MAGTFEQAFKLSLPPGSRLTGTEAGGAEVVKNGDTLVTVAPPNAIDARGESVPVEMAVTGDVLVITVSPEASTQLPVLLDPLFQSFSWEAGEVQTGITGNTGYEEWSPETVGGYTNYPYVNDAPPFQTHNNLNGEYGEYGLDVSSATYPAKEGDHAAFIYTVPRYFHDNPKPTSFISGMSLSGLTWWAGSEVLSPYLKAGLWDINQKDWVSLLSIDGYKEHGVSDTSHVYEFENKSNNKEVKVASIGLWAMEDVSAYDPAQVRATTATVELGESEDDLPSFAPIGSPTQWLNQSSAPFDFTVSDSGLGVYSIMIALDGEVSPSWTTKYGCTGVPGDACPRIWSKYSSAPSLVYDPGALPQGIDTLSFVAEDPLGHKSQVAKAQVKVDHTAPTLSISGPLSEVAAVGESWPTYRLDISANDGTKSAPQSGVAATTVKVDGKVVSESAPGCETESCSTIRSWTLEADQFSAGKHTLQVTALDGVGLAKTKTRAFKLDPAPAPEVGLAGSLTEQEALGSERPRYSLDVDASTEAGQKYKAPAPIASFGFGGSHLSSGEDIALDSQGNVWALRSSEGRIAEFDSGGNFVKEIGEYSYKGCGLDDPRDLAVDASDNIWVANGNGFIAKYNAKGECLLSFGGSEAGEGSVGNASCIGVDKQGNVWVCDWEKGHVLKFSASGKYLSQFGSYGTEKGQLHTPTDIAFGLSGELWISEEWRVQKFSAGGQLLGAIDESGWGNGELYGPTGLATDSEGNLYVVETTKNRVEEFTADGEYRSQFGYYGTGLGQFYWPEGIAIDPKGNFWVADTHNNRIEKWVAPPRPLEPVIEAGTSGSGEGQLSAPTGIATDPEGNHWVADTGNDRVEEFGPEGEYLSQFGESGSEEGQLSEPHGVAIDTEGNLWVTDSGNGRVEHFTPEGEYLGEVEQAVFPLEYPTGIAIDEEETIWVADTQGDRVERFGPEGEWDFGWFLELYGTVGYGGELDEPHGLAVDRNNDILIADTANNRIDKVSESGEYLGEIGDESSGAGALYRPTDVNVDLDGDLWVASPEAWSVEEFSPQGDYLSLFGMGKYGSLEEPYGVAAGPGGNIWVTAGGADQLQAWRPEGIPASLTLSVGTSGSGEGQLSAPTGIATDPEGNHWVADTGNDRVEEFGPEGEYLSQFGESGSEEGQLSEPHGVAIDTEGNLWVTDSGNGRVEHFTPEGEYLGEVEQAVFPLEYPTGIAIDEEETIWVADTQGDRVERFGPEGEWLWEWIGTSGSGKGQMQTPFGIAVDANSNVWVADAGNHRIDKFSEAGAPLGEYGQEGSGAGSLSQPLGITVDATGDVWASDASSGRVKGFDSQGHFVGNFGQDGSTNQLEEPFGLSAGPDGRVWVSDVDADRIQAWNPSPSNGSTSQVDAEISVDGEQVLETSASCAAAVCEVSPEWLLDSTTLAEGEHEVEVQATDAYGRTSTETLPIEIEADEIKPTIQAGGELFNAPEGWVEQEAYGLSVSATDSGYGVTSVDFEIDGKEVAASNQKCPDGGCEETLANSIDISEYSGGAHAAEIVATDGAGNEKIVQWTLNVDPEGHITIGEAEDTLKAVDATAGSTLVAPTAEIIDVSEREDGNNPQLEEAAENNLISSGIPDVSVIASNPENGFTIGTPETTVEAQPLSTAVDSTPATISNDATTISSNTNSNADTIIRPVFNGTTVFQSIRNTAGPETFSWKVRLFNDQTLYSVDDQTAEVDFSDGTPALTITAEPAHDAVGMEVPTTLSVSEGEVVTLHVHHHENTFTYPVIAGSGWEGGFSTQIVARPKNEQEIREEREQREREEQEAQELLESGEVENSAPVAEYFWVGPPIALANGSTDNEGATISTANHKAHSLGFRWDQCAWSGPLGCAAWDVAIAGRFEYNGKYAWWKENKPHPSCPYGSHLSSIAVDHCGWAGQNHQPYGNGYHISARVLYHLTGILGATFSAPEHLTVYLYGDGYVSGHNTAALCNPLSACE